MTSRSCPFLALVGWSLIGCGRALGPESLPTTTLAGRVRIGHRILERGWVEIVPVDGTRGRLRSIPIGRDGRFQSDGVPIGRVGLRIAGPPLPASDHGPLNQFLEEVRRGYSVRRTIAPDSPPLDLDLQAEYYTRLGEQPGS